MPRATAIPLVIEQLSPIRGHRISNGRSRLGAGSRRHERQAVKWSSLGTGCAGEPYTREVRAERSRCSIAAACDVSAKIREGDGRRRASALIVAMVDDQRAAVVLEWRRMPAAGRRACFGGRPEKSLADSIRRDLAARRAGADLLPRNGIFAHREHRRTRSARGPSYDYNQIKPDLAAPGASISADVGTGSREEAFSGTSGSASMVAGAAALMLEAYPNRAPWAIKSALMNTAGLAGVLGPGVPPECARTDHAHRRR